MITKSIKEGVRLAVRRPGLTAIVFLSHAAIAFVLSIPIYQSLMDSTGASGFGADLVTRFDLVLFADIMEDASDAVQSVLVQLLWIVPAVVLWKTAMAVGILHALRWGGVGSFWDGLGRFTLRALVIAAMNFAMLGLLVATAAAIVALIGLATSQFPVIFGGILAVLLLVFADFADDYGRVVLVSDRSQILRSWWSGVTYGFRRPAAVAVYVAWAVAAVALTLLVVRLHPSWAREIGTVWLLFLGQQALLVIRSGVSVAWLGAELTFHESTNFQEAPLLAGSAVVEGTISA